MSSIISRSMRQMAADSIAEQSTFTIKLGETNRAGPRTRIWIEGARLLRHGFTARQLVLRVWGEHRLILMPTSPNEWNAAARDERGSIAGTETRPIIDITGALVFQTFRTERVTVKFANGNIDISEAAR